MPRSSRDAPKPTRVPRSPAHGAAFLMAVIAAAPADAEWTTNLYGSHAIVATLDTSDVQESSGIVASRTSPDLYWTHNDSGGSARVWAFRLSAADKVAGVARKIGSVQLLGASNVDWEDIAAGPGDTIYVFDGGDNPPCERTDKRIYRITEPAIDPGGPVVSLSATPDSFRFEYPDSTNPALPADANAERYDCETLLVHPTTGDVCIVTKRTDAGVATARVYKLPAAVITWNSPAVHVLQFLADLSAKVPSLATGGDIDPFGRRVVIRNYANAYEFTLPDGQPFDQIFAQARRALSMSGEIQGEGIGYAIDGRDLVATSEVFVIGPTTCPVFLTPWTLANTRATDVRATHATIRWDTAATVDSTVDYGTTTAYGTTASDSAAATSHAIELSNLAPNTTYYYRVTSGSLVYPAPADATTVFFTTPPLSPADFDADGDVDVADFLTFQACFNGPDEPPAQPDCAGPDLDSDNDVDIADFLAFQACFNGPNAPPACAL